MAVRFTGHNYRDTHGLYVRVHDAPAITRKSGKRRMAAEHAQIRYIRSDGGDWGLDHVTVSGGLLKKDETPGSQIVTERFYRYDRHDWPKWLVELVEMSQPAIGAQVAEPPVLEAAS